MKKSLIYICCTVLLFLEIFCIRGIAILAETFPLENTEAVLFTLSQNIAGADSFALSITLEILRDSFIISSLVILTIIVVLKILRAKKKFTYINLIASLNIICLPILATTFYINIPISKYYQKLNNTDIFPEYTDIYETEYVYPDSVKIEFKEKRNLILVFLESVEYNFQDSVNGGTLHQNLIPEITEYLKQEQSFIPGGTQIEGTGWTMADVIAKTCGIPLILTPIKREHPTPHGMFIPGATCLTDILHNNGYTSIVSKGAQLSFSNMDAFVRTHSIDFSYGLDEYKRDWHIDERILNEWGISDSTHYELIKEHIGKVSTTGKPWAVWFITLNTHTPYGANDPACHIPGSIKSREKLYSSIRCSSKQLDNFIKWTEAQEWFKNTTIAVMGDHATMASPHITGFKGKKQNHYWLNFFVNPAISAKIYRRTFSSLDMFPTILEAMGAKIPGRALGLGRSLYSLAPTLPEQYGLDSLNKALKNNSHKYDYFFYFDKKNSPNR